MSVCEVIVFKFVCVKLLYCVSVCKGIVCVRVCVCV